MRWLTALEKPAASNLAAFSKDTLRDIGPLMPALASLNGSAGVQYSMDENGVLAPTGPVPDQPTLPKVVLEPDVTEYRYEYDEYGNWSRETTVRRFGANEHSAVRRHVLTYY